MDGQNNGHVKSVDMRRRNRLMRMWRPLKIRPVFRRIVGVLGLVLLIVGVGIVVQQQRVIARDQCNGRENNATYSRAASSMFANRTADLKPIVSTIQTARSYQKDPNCLLIAATYYVYTGDLATAQSLSQKLSTHYDSKKGYVKALSQVSQTPAQVRTQIDYLTKRNNEFRANARFSD